MTHGTQTGFAPLILQLRMAQQADGIQKFGSVVMLAAPIADAPVQVPAHHADPDGVRRPHSGIDGAHALMVTLPVEFDASFRRAMHC